MLKNVSSYDHYYDGDDTYIVRLYMLHKIQMFRKYHISLNPKFRKSSKAEIKHSKHVFSYCLFLLGHSVDIN